MAHHSAVRRLITNGGPAMFNDQKYRTELMNTQSSIPDQPQLLDGKVASAQIIADIRTQVANAGIQPGLAVVLVGEDPASQVYVNSKSKRAEECGFYSQQHTLSEQCSEQELLTLIRQLNEDPAIHGILVQLPLPRHIDPDVVIQAIDPDKDVDGFHYLNVGRLGTGAVDTALVPCTPLGCMHMAKAALGDNLRGKHAVIVGRSNIVGKPVANLLLQESCTVSIVHSGTPNPEQICQLADILVVAVGVPQLVKSDWVKEGAVVIDVGINRIETPEGGNRLVGDVDFDDVQAKTAAITPVPGGVGPMTIAMLMQNTLTSALRHQR